MKTNKNSVKAGGKFPIYTLFGPVSRRL